VVAVMTSVDEALNRLKLVSVGVFAHNEAGTIIDCIRRLLAEELPDDDWMLTEVVVVVSGDDGTDDVVRKIAAGDDRV